MCRKSFKSSKNECFSKNATTNSVSIAKIGKFTRRYLIKMINNFDIDILNRGWTHTIKLPNRQKRDKIRFRCVLSPISLSFGFHSTTTLFSAAEQNVCAVTPTWGRLLGRRIEPHRFSENTPTQVLVKILGFRLHHVWPRLTTQFNH